MRMPNLFRFDWKTGGIVIGVLSLICSFPVSASGDVSVSLHFLIVSGCLLYGIYKEKSEFLIPYLVELVIILIQCVISIVNFILLKPYDERNFEDDVVTDFFYENPKHFTAEEKRFMLGALGITSVVIIFFWAVILALYRRMRYVPELSNGMVNVENGIEGKICA
ncbi:uncharacterized protein LOC129578830 [Sitodiplosis mosellana]|uniref:uncharacterized protein LOC129578830 n=1 Tax=Sitodiplosis mosellana TaxID=263140 RepID=UPI0024449ABB|nr:uncharacterized protein LOC129578830 [Sitodiplosis mosellana]